MKKVINGVEVEVDEQGNPVAAADEFSGLNLDDPDFDPDAEVLKRGSMAVLKENKKKGQELRELREKLRILEAVKPPVAPALPNASEPQLIADYRAMMTRKGYDKEYIDAQIKLMGFVGIQMAQQTIAPAEKAIYGDVLDKTITEVGQEPDSKLAFAVKKFRAQIKEHIQANYPSKYWQDKNLVKSAIGIIVAENLDKLQEPTGEEPPAQPPVEDNSDKGKLPPKLPGMKFSEEEIASYASQHGWDINVKGVRENVVKSMTLRANIAKKEQEEQK